MSAPYKKAFRRIPNASKYLLDAAFEIKGYENGIGAGIDYYEQNEPETYELFVFLETADAPLSKQFEIYLGNSFGSHDAMYYVVNPLTLPNVRSKKKRTQKHAKLVALSNVSRTHKKERDRQFKRTPSTASFEVEPSPVPTDGPF